MSQTTQLPIVTMADIQAMPDNQVILVLHGYVCNVTEYLQQHPGGSDILRQYDRQDASELFEKIGHSETARSVLQQYVIARLENSICQPLDGSSTHEPLAWPQQIKAKLMTHEDPYFIHKSLGGLVLLHICIRSTMLLLDTIQTILSQSHVPFSTSDMFSFWPMFWLTIAHGALSLSSLMFDVPEHANQNKPMIHRMFRAHSICFAVRAVLVMLLHMLIIDPEVRQYLISWLVLSCFFIADIITQRLTAADDRYKTTASMPYWPECSPKRQAIHKYLYGFAQYLASMICLFGSYAVVFFTLPAIQGAAFLMTLVRKNLISAYTYHHIYTILLFYPLPFLMMLFPSRSLLAVMASWLLFHLRRCGVNKYLLWAPILVIACCFPSADWSQDLHPYAMGTAVTLLFGCGLMMFVSRTWDAQEKSGTSSSERIDYNNRVLSCTPIGVDGYELIVRTKLPLNLHPGQHVLIQIDDTLSRKYTPIWCRHLPKTNQSLLALRIKRYVSDQGITASSYLTSRESGAVLALFGPHGSKYICPEKNAIVDEAQQTTYPLSEYQVDLLAAGTGITPIYQLAKHILQHQPKPLTLITCDHSQAHQIMGQALLKLQQQHPQTLRWHCFFSQQTSMETADFPAQVHFKHLDGQALQQWLKPDPKKLVIMCGPPGWQQMVTSALDPSQVARIITW